MVSPTAALVVVGIAIAVIAGKFFYRRKAQREIRQRIDLERQDAVSLLHAAFITYSLMTILLILHFFHHRSDPSRRSWWFANIQ